jgi:hypothetical protein
MGTCRTCGAALGEGNATGLCRIHANSARRDPNSRRSRAGVYDRDPDVLNRHAEASAGMARNEAAARARAARLASDTEPLKPGDIEAQDYGEQRQAEYKAQMGEFAGTLRGMGEDPAKVAAYVSELAEQERRWLNKRLARSMSLGAARELLAARQFEAIASRVVWPVRAQGYAARPKHGDPSRAGVMVLSDLHIGANLPGYENPEAFDFTGAGRRLASLAYETGEFKTQYRDKTELVLGLNGDIIEGLLGWNDADNFPFAEQMVAAAQFLVSVVAYLAAAFPSVRVFCQTGNHGRIKTIHEGRATSSKANSFETILYKQIEAQCVRALPNVRFHIPRAPWTVIPIFDHRLLMTHGDTELGLKSIDSSGGVAVNEAVLAKAQSEATYGPGIGGLVFGHFHRPGLVPASNGWLIAQGALVPPNGHARAGRFSGVCGFWIWEAVPGYLVGDSRFLRVGPKHDTDATLDDIVPRFDPWGNELPPVAA